MIMGAGEAAEPDLKHILTELEKGKEKGGDSSRRAARSTQRGGEAEVAMGCSWE